MINGSIEKLFSRLNISDGKVGEMKKRSSVGSYLTSAI